MKKMRLFFLICCAFLSGVYVDRCVLVTNNTAAKEPYDLPIKPKINDLDVADRWLPSVVDSETALDQILLDNYWINHPLVKQRLKQSDTDYLCYYCNPYSGFLRTHIFLFVVSNHGMRLLTHIVAENIYPQNVQAQFDDDGRILFIDQRNEPLVIATVLLGKD